MSQVQVIKSSKTGPPGHRHFCIPLKRTAAVVAAMAASLLLATPAVAAPSTVSVSQVSPAGPSERALRETTMLATVEPATRANAVTARGEITNAYSNADIRQATHSEGMNGHWLTDRNGKELTLPSAGAYPGEPATRAPSGHSSCCWTALATPMDSANGPPQPPGKNRAAISTVPVSHVPAASLHEQHTVGETLMLPMAGTATGTTTLVALDGITNHRAAATNPGASAPAASNTPNGPPEPPGRAPMIAVLALMASALVTAYVAAASRRRGLLQRASQHGIPDARNGNVRQLAARLSAARPFDWTVAMRPVSLAGGASR